MIQKVTGTLNGVGSKIYIGLGGIPKTFKIQNLESANTESIYWADSFRSAECLEGIYDAFDGTQVTRDEFGYGEGIAPYRGGDVVAAGNTTYLVPITDRDQRASGTGSTVSAWTLDTSANRTGHFDANISTTYVGEGSEVIIKPSNETKIYRVKMTALSNDGDAADDVTLSEVIQSGTVLFIGPMYDYVAADAGTTMPAGISIAETANVNVSGEMCQIEAEMDIG